NEDRAGPHAGEPPVVAKVPALEVAIVGVPSNLELPRVEFSVSDDGLCHLENDFLTDFLQLVAAGVKEHIAGQLDDDAIVSYVHLESKASQLLELLAELLKLGADPVELRYPLFVLG